jgi:hypothetical protein
MIRVALVDAVFGSTRYVEFDAVPVAGRDQYQCIPAGTLARESAIELAYDVARGSMSGSIQGYRWYRQARGVSDPIMSDDCGSPRFSARLYP